MATYLMPPAHERLNVFFGEFFREMRKVPPQAYGSFLARAEQEFQRLGYREKFSSGVENILVTRFRNFSVMLESIAVFCRDHLWQKKLSFAFTPQETVAAFKCLERMI